MIIKSSFNVLVVACLLSCCSSLTVFDGNGYEFKDGDRIVLSLKNETDDIIHKVIVKKILMAPRSRVSFQLLDVPVDVSFILTQVHSYKYNVTLGYYSVMVPSTFINGTNLGLVKQNTGMPPHNMEFFIVNHNKIQVMCLLAFEAYNDDDPVPGGCNREFSVEIAPYLLLSYNDAVVTMTMQPAAFTGQDDECDTFPSPVELEVYHMYMDEKDFSSESYFESIKKMMKVETMMESGTLIQPPPEGGPLLRIRASYPGTGSVYGVVARSQNGRVATYVPAVTYACGNRINMYDDCEIFTMPFSEVLCASMLFIGMFICLCGHRKFLAGSSLVSFLWGTVLSCMILGMNYGTGYGIDMLGILVGFLLAVGWWILWILFGIPVIAALSSTLALGFLLASAIMYAGLGSVPWLVYDFSFWSVFTSITITVPVLFGSAMHVGNMVACATLGAYVFVAPIDHYVGSNLKYIFLNTMRRAIHSDFRLATIDPPFEITDLLLILTWLTLAVAGTGAQLYLQRRRPPFPPRTAWCFPERAEQAARRDASQAVGGGGGGGGAGAAQQAQATTQPRRSLLLRAALAGRGGGGGGGGSERTPLLVDVRIPDGATPDSVFESPARSPARHPHLLHTPPGRPSAPPDPDHSHHAALDPASSTEKLANKLLAVLEPGDK